MQSKWFLGKVEGQVRGMFALVFPWGLVLIDVREKPFPSFLSGRYTGPYRLSTPGKYLCCFCLLGSFREVLSLQMVFCAHPTLSTDYSNNVQ